jgi:hypothetical protein
MVGCNQDTGGARPPGVNPIVLDRKWIDTDEPEHALSGQLLIKAQTNWDMNSGDDIAILTIILPNTDEVVWADLSGGTRKILVFAGQKYMVDILEVRKDGVRISIIRSNA